MKKLIYLTSLLSIALIWNSCAKEDIDTYCGDDAIYFLQQWGVTYYENNIDPTGGMKNVNQAYSKISFGEMITNDSLLVLNIHTSGFIKDYDRPFSIEVVNDSTTAFEGIEYELLDSEAVIEAGKVSTKIRIMFHKTPRMDNENLRVQLSINPGEHFVIPFDSLGYGKMPIMHSQEVQRTEYPLNNNPGIHNIYVNNFLVEPARWNSTIMGTWSEEKFRLLLDYTGEMLGWTVATWNDEAKMWPPGNGYQVGLNFLGPYLRDQYLKGREYWVLDPDGSMMWCKHAALTGLWSEDTRPENMMDN